jgi:tetratricopeptide (TPR) repeat protein
MQLTLADLHQLAAREYHAGNKGRAVDILEGAIQDHPTNAWLIGEMGGILVDMGRKGVGQALLTLACSMEKEKGAEDWRHWSTLGSTRESLEFRELAEQAFEEALRVDPNQSDIWDQWSGVYVNNGNPERCAELARKSLELNPNNPIAKKHLSLALLELGQWCEAWPLMEARKLIRDYQRPVYNLPQWKGQEVDTLIIHGGAADAPLAQGLRGLCVDGRGGRQRRLPDGRAAEPSAAVRDAARRRPGRDGGSVAHRDRR